MMRPDRLGVYGPLRLLWRVPAHTVWADRGATSNGWVITALSVGVMCSVAIHSGCHAQWPGLLEASDHCDRMLT